MIALIQRVTRAQVSINDQVFSAINTGILALIGLEKTDTTQNADKLIDKILNYRIFPDAEGKTNLNLKAIEGGLLLVPQFTLVAETNKGTRPGFSRGMAPKDGQEMFELIKDIAKAKHERVEVGEFGANMQVDLVNDGPMTFWLDIKKPAARALCTYFASGK